MLLEKTYRFVPQEFFVSLVLVLAMTLVAPAKTNLGLATKPLARKFLALTVTALARVLKGGK
jgi:hypothetical protein